MRIDWITKLDDSNVAAYYYATLPGAMAYIMPGLDGTADAYINLDNGVRLTAPRTFPSVPAAKRWVKRQAVAQEAQPQVIRSIVTSGFTVTLEYDNGEQETITGADGDVWTEAQP